MTRDELERMYRVEDTYWWFIGRRRLVRALIKRLLPGPRQRRILDVGCGTGGTLDAIGDLGDVWGADVSSDALDFCRERGITQLKLCAAESLCFEDGSFDAVISCDVLEHLDDDSVGLAEMKRVLRPGGYAIITVPAHKWLWSEHDVALEHRRRYNAKELRRKLHAAGLRIERFSYAVSLMFPALIAFRILRRLKPHSRPQTEFLVLPKPLSDVLIAMLKVEELCVCTGLPLPPGASLVAAVSKPEAAD
jgi:SAM-dependent methyltransferase